MERLTRWNGEKYLLPQGRTSDGQSYWRIIAERLAEYENRDMSLDQIDALISNEANRLAEARESSGYSPAEVDIWVRGCVLGMLKAFMAVRMLTESDAIEIMFKY